MMNKKKILKVSSKSNASTVARTITKLLKYGIDVELQVIGAGALNVAVKSVIIARNYIETIDMNLMCIPEFLEIDMREKPITGIKLILVTHKLFQKKINNQEKDKPTAEEIQTLRVKIANMVARDKTINRRCCICGKENAEILHNQEDPYFITFLCRTCRTNEDNVKKAEKTRFNLREHKSKLTELSEDKTYLHTNQYTPETVKSIVDRYLFKTQDKNLGEYCKEIGLSRYQFNSVLDLYTRYFPEDKGKIDQVHNKRKAVQRERLSIDRKHMELHKRIDKYNNIRK